jgi:hypothetical protein
MLELEFLVKNFEKKLVKNLNFFLQLTTFSQ